MPEGKDWAMNLTRTFHPVGQGAFYSEEFRDEEGNCVFRVVYDCGSLKYCKLQRNSDGSLLARQDIKNRVSGAFSDDHGIDVLFISHLDEGHVNLIPCLEAFQHRRIRRVVLPLLTVEERYILLGYHLIKSRGRRISGVLESIVTAPEEYFGNDTEVTFVRPTDGERSVVENEMDEDGVGIDDLQQEVPSLTKILIGKGPFDNGQMPRWLLIPYNHKPERYSNLKDELVNVFGKEFLIENLKDTDFVIRNLKTLRCCYKVLQDGINRNSMALYSGPLDCACSIRGEVVGGNILGCYCPCDQFAEYWLDRVLRLEQSSIFHGCPGCLYTGDISLDDTDLMRAFGRYVKNIGMVQLPHHGSLDSFGKGNLPIEWRVCVATYGERNSFGHPAFAVKRAVAQRGGLWVDVTETEESRFKVEFNVK